MWKQLWHSAKLTILKSNKQKIKMLGPIPLPRKIGNKEVILNWYPFVRLMKEDTLYVSNGLNDEDTDLYEFHQIPDVQLTVNSLLIYGSFQESDTPLVRVHSGCVTGDIFGSLRCDCNDQLETSFQRIIEAGVGAIVYMASHGLNHPFGQGVGQATSKR